MLKGYLISNIYPIINLLAILLGGINFIFNKSTKRIHYISMYCFCIIGLLFGAKIIYLIENMQSIEYFNIFNGYSFVGGILLYIIFRGMYDKMIYKVDKKTNSLIVLSISEIYGIAKISCCIVGCCRGITTFSLQLIECFIYITIFAVSLCIYLNKRIFKYSSIISIELLCLARFIIDFYRVDRKVLLFNISISQIICLVIIVYTYISDGTKIDVNYHGEN